MNERPPPLVNDPGCYGARPRKKSPLAPPPNRVRGGRGRAPTPEPVAVLVGVSGARVPPDRRTARPWVCGVLAGLPRGQVACLACVSVPVGGAVGRVPAWWPCWCWCAYPWAAGLPGGRAVASASPCPGDSPTAHPVQFSKAIMKEWHATCNPHKTCLIDRIYFEARQVARYDHTRAETLPASPP